MPSAASSASASAKSARMKRVSHGASWAICSKRSAAAGSRSIAISVPSGPSRSAIRREWPPPPKVQSTTVSPGAGIGVADQLRGEDWDVLGRHVGKCHHLTARSPAPGGAALRQARRSVSSRRLLLVLLVLGEPLVRASRSRGACPCPVIDAAAVEAGVLDQLLAEPDAAGRVELGGLGVREEAALEPAGVAAHRVERRERAPLASPRRPSRARPRRRARCPRSGRRPRRAPPR